MNSDPINGTSPIVALVPEQSHVIVGNGKRLVSTLGDLTGRAVQMARHLPTTMRGDLKTAVAILSVSNIIFFSIVNEAANRLNKDWVIDKIVEKKEVLTSEQVEFKNGLLNGLVTTVVVLTNFAVGKILRYDPLQRPLVLVAIAAGTWAIRNLIRPNDSDIEVEARQLLSDTNENSATTEIKPLNTAETSQTKSAVVTPPSVHSTPNKLPPTGLPTEQEQEKGKEGEGGTPSAGFSDLTSSLPSLPGTKRSATQQITDILQLRSTQTLTEDTYRKSLAKINKTIQLFTDIINNPSTLTPTSLTPDSNVGKAITAALLIVEYNQPKLQFVETTTIVEQLTLLRDRLKEIETTDATE